MLANVLDLLSIPRNIHHGSQWVVYRQEFQADFLTNVGGRHGHYSFKCSRQILTNDLNQVLSFSLLMTASTALANKGLLD